MSPFKKKRSSFRWRILIILMFVSGAAAYLYYYFYPGFFFVDSPEKLRVVLGGELLDIPVLLEKEEILLPVEAVRDYLDNTLYWDEAEQLLILTSKNRVIRMKSDHLTAYINKKDVGLHIPVTIIDEVPYMPLYFLEEFYGISITVNEHAKTVIIDRRDTPYMEAYAEKSVFFRDGPSLQAPRVDILETGEQVRVLREEDGWYQIRSSKGFLGYAPKKELHLIGISSEWENPPKVEEPPWRPTGSRISLVWEHVVNKTPSVETIKAMPGVNVLSPTWFHLRDEEGNLINLADSSYVTWAHGKGYQVWALVSNNFDRDTTAAVLRSSEKREKVIDQLLAFSALYHLDGINVDFENMYPEDRDNLTQFMRELAPLAREQGLVLSIDVTFISGNLYWSLIYDRPALAEAADYIIVMAYDEHWGTSPVAGSVASLPWVERGLQRVLREVPADKLILGLPLYTRLWEIEYLEGGAEKVVSRAYGMDRIQSILAEEGAHPVFNEESGQNYASFDRGDRHYKVWVEDLISLESRLDLAEKYGLAGVAAWRRGFESEEVWELFGRRLNIKL